MGRTTGFAAFALALSQLPGLAIAQVPVARVQGAGVERTIDCSATPRVEVTGEGNVVRLVGTCRKVKLSGLRHVVLAEGLERVEMSGANHRVEWQSTPAGAKPKVDDNGLGNRVIRVDRAAAPAAVPSPTEPAARAESASAPQAQMRAESRPEIASPSPRREGALVARGQSIEISSAGEHRQFRCDGGSLVVSGSNNDILAWGDCERIEINGYGNRVRVEGIRNLEVNGVNQDVSWVRAVGDERPRIESHGMGNRVRQVELNELR